MGRNLQIWACLLVITGAGMVGCTTSLFPEDAPRTPYDRYLALRGESRPPKVVDVNGRERPALRERLRPLDRP